jgi:DNA polymerase-1
MVRVIQYWKTLPVKTISIDKVEADDIISYLSNVVVNKPEDKVFIVSSDKDFIQLVNDNVIVYRPMEKEYYTEQTVIDKYKMSPKNFVLCKIKFLGDILYLSITVCSV